VRAFEPGATSADETHQFEASAGYIEGNTITGTPSEPFHDVGALATGPNGDIYVAETHSVQVFAPAGTFVRTVGTTEVPAGSMIITAIAVDPTSENLLIAGIESGAWVIDEFGPAGVYLSRLAGTPAGSFGVVRGLAIDSHGFLYAADNSNHVVDEFLPLGIVIPEATTEPATGVQRGAATLHAKADPAGGGPIISCSFSYADDADYQPWAANPYGSGPSTGAAPCLNGADETVGTPGHPITEPTELHAPIGIASFTTPPGGGTIHWRLSVANADEIPRNVPGQDVSLPPAVTEVKTGTATELTNHSASLHASFTAESGIETHYWFEYGTSTNYGHKTPQVAVPGPASGAEAENAMVAIEGLAPHTAYHYRVVAENEFGTVEGEDKTFATEQVPAIESFSSSDVTATSAVLHARINPNVRPGGTEAECRFEYGPTSAYGSSEPCPGKLTGTTGKAVEVEIKGLQSGIVYHFRVVAENQWGGVATEDQSFEFFPPGCPNAAVRQQTGSNYLPDCRGYELVSPGEANGAFLFAGGPNTGQATAPSRLAFTAAFSILPGANAINTAGDLYVATRTDAGWVSKYIGLPGDEAGCMGGPPPYVNNAIVDPAWVTNGVLADPSMGHFLNWLEIAPAVCGLGENGIADRDTPVAPPSDAPFLWRSDGSLERRLPSNLSQVPGALEALACPQTCNGEATASGDLTHLVFSSASLAFAPGGLGAAPGSAYDDNLATGEVSLISKLPATQGGGPIPEEPNQPGGFIHFPAVSTDGSHILMATSTAAPFGACINHDVAGPEHSLSLCPSFTNTPLHLYMRVDDEVTYDVSQGKDVHYVGATPDLSKVYFSSEERLSSEDKDDSTDLYMWSEAGAEEGHPLTLVSKGDNAGNKGEPGNTDDCHPATTTTYWPPEFQPGSGGGTPSPGSPWTAKCGALPYSDHSYALASTGGIGGNDIADSAIATNGDIYFYSPEQLDGDLGALGQQNLYLYRGGEVQFVATLSPERRCAATGTRKEYLACPEGPVLRMEVSPGDTHMAFVTAAHLSAYDNAGHLEMYSYAPATGDLVCDSCNPAGTPASAEVQASEDGRFMTDDGRAFFSTTEALVPRDTNEGEDVYEFADGRPQLITPGTASESASALSGEALSVSVTSQVPGLVGVSADGTDVYFATFASLVSEDHNGHFFKFYDARTNGGFPQVPQSPPCAAAEECHGQGTAAPLLPTQGTAAGLSGGNVSPKSHKRRKKHHKKTSAKHRHARHNRGGGK
jgi:hypothetical protein